MKLKITVFSLSLLTWLNVYAQKSDFVKSDRIEYAVHQSNTGKIAFMEQTVPIETFSEKDFLTSFVLKEKADLNIRVFLAQSLTNSLHAISPQSTVDELTQNGNYQFTFIVDHQKVYVENLNTGAGTAESKNQKTVFRVPLISAANEDSWGKFLWNRFLGNGGQEALSEGEHLLRIEIRPYVKLNGVLTGNIIAEGQVKITVPEIKIDENAVKIQPVKPTPDWKMSTAQIDRAAIEDLNRKIAKQTFKNITGVVAIKGGKLLIEEYFNGADRNTLHDTRSVGKSFASALLGIAISDGYIKSEDQTLKDFYPLKKYQNYTAAKDAVSLKSLLTMSSAFDGSDMNSESPGNEENMYPSENWVDFTLNLPLDPTKTAHPQWDYFTAGCIVLGDVIHHSVPNGMEKYADKKLFKPLNITRYQWQYTPQKVPNTAGSLQLTALDLAKFGQLYQNKGRWNGQQILSEEWVAKSLSHQTSLSDNEFYGYLFWNKTYQVNGKAYEVYYSSGNGGNRIYIFKDEPLIIVLTSTAYNTPYGETQAEKIMQQHLLPAILKY